MTANVTICGLAAEQTVATMLYPYNGLVSPSPSLAPPLVQQLRYHECSQADHECNHSTPAHFIHSKYSNQLCASQPPTPHAESIQQPMKFLPRQAKAYLPDARGTLIM